MSEQTLHGNTIRAIFRRHPNVAIVRQYLDGFVPNSYKWPCNGTAVEWEMIDGKLVKSERYYDRKRAYGDGPTWTAMTATSGVVTNSRKWRK